MTNTNVRVRFAPSPTGGLHLGGVRTVLFNYLFARRHGGTFVVRIEDTDQNRFVPGAEEYIFETLAWCGLEPDESVTHGGDFAPYRQSERKATYRLYAEQLVNNGFAYYAFDTPEELETMRNTYKTEHATAQYSAATRGFMRNSLTLGEDETLRLINEGVPYVIRIKIPEIPENIVFTDMIRGEVSFHTSTTDDKVLLKADGMPTYHLAVVVDDYLMQISHAFRGEEWLPSAPVHILLWRYLFGEDKMPQWAHFPLILKPNGHGKLSKRDGAKFGFPVYAKNWTDPSTGEIITGFKESGFLPEAFINMLAMLGWNDSSGQEIFTLQELTEKFSIERVHKAGAKFDYEKAKWFNHEWIKRLPVSHYSSQVKEMFVQKHIAVPNDEAFEKVLDMVKDRCTLLTDFIEQASYFFQPPQQIDISSIKPKWTEQKTLFFVELMKAIELSEFWEAEKLEKMFKEIVSVHLLKPGELMLPFRIMLVGGKFGPGVFEIAESIGKEQTIQRIRHTLQLLS